MRERPSDFPSTLSELTHQSALAAIALQDEDGSFPPSERNDRATETPVRTTGRWLITLARVYEQTGDPQLVEPAEQAIEYLISEDARPHGYTFHSRQAGGKSRCDGLVGQAAPIQGLAEAGRVFDRPDLRATAKKVFSLHPFDRDLGLWRYVEIDGKERRIDRTINHQITFASSVIPLVQTDGQLRDHIDHFLSCLHHTLGVHDSGVIRHYVRPPLRRVVRSIPSTPSNVNLVWNALMNQTVARQQSFHQKELAYHPINLRGLGLLRRAYPDHEIWDSAMIRSVVRAGLDEDVLAEAERISMGSPIPRIHSSLALLMLSNRDFPTIRRMILEDLEKSYDPTTGLLVKQTDQFALQASNMYFLTYSPNISL